MPKAQQTATLDVSCNPCDVGSIAEFTGTGYTINKNANVWISGSFQSTIPVYPDGTVKFGWYMSAAGVYDVKLYQEGRGGKLSFKAGVVTVAR